MTRNKTKEHINVRDLKPRKDAKGGVGRNFRVRDLKASKDAKGGIGNNHGGFRSLSRQNMRVL